MKSNKEFNDALKNKYGYLIRVTEKIYAIKIKPEKYSLYEIQKILNETDKKIFLKNNWYNKKLEELKKLYTTKSRFYKSA